ncbi:MAG: ATP-binding protein [Bacteroidota bacterium]
MRAFFRTLFHYKIDPLEDYESVLAQVLKWVILVLIIIGLPSVTTGIIEAIRLEQVHTAILYAIFFSPLVIVAVLQDRLHHKWGAAIVLSCLFIFAVHNITVFGFSGAGIPIFLTFFILMTVFYGRKAGLLSIVASIIPMAVIGYLMVQGIMSLDVNLMHISTLPVSWVTATSIMFLLGILVVVGFSFIQQNFTHITRISKTQAEELRKMNQSLKEEIRHKEEIQENLERAKEKAEESDRLKSAFLKNMSHEIRTPMNGIMGFASLLECDHQEAEKVDEYVEMIKKSGNRMLELLNNLMAIAMIESGETKIRKKETALNTLMDILQSQFMLEAEKKNLSLVTEKGFHDHEDEIVTDGDKLKQILTHLLNNAVKYTHKGRITFGYRGNDGAIQFYVSDTGIGISHDMQKKIFERFRQVELRTTREYDGAGLGLSIARAYVEMMGGRMWLNSTPGQGSTFYFTIFHQSSDEDVTPGENASASIKQQLPGDLKLLVVEDDETSYMLIREIMDDTGITLLRAKNGKEAVEKLNDLSKDDLILMDIKMPVMDGYEATRAIKQARPELPVIAQTAYYSEEDRKKALNAGCDAYVTKPINVEELMGWIQRLLSVNRESS